MEDIIQILVVIAIVAVAIVQKIGKRKAATAKGKQSPNPKGHEDIFTAQPAEKRKKPTSSPFLSYDLPSADSGGKSSPQHVNSNTEKDLQPDSYAPTDDTEPSSTYLEDAKRGIIWSEIIQRKY